MSPPLLRVVVVLVTMSVTGVALAGTGAEADPEEPSIEAGARAAWLHRLGALEEKMLGLVRAMPPETLDWRPAEGVRSAAEALGHVAYTQYKLAEMAGTPLPDGVDLEAVAHPEPDAEAVARILEASFAHLRDAMRAVPVDGLDRPAQFWGRPSTVRRVLLKSVTHTAEHLGQMVAYGRMNGVVPPWSRARGERKGSDSDSD
ncbi:MAG: DinB family protein [Myxococcota bacterium]